ncbi:indolepyruvate ferredoxin oxidoreductase subunit alpha [Thermosediminibacter litoriperuensis]|uniref:Indolepyruvate oxidoreductase subunit IorA n=1 Tax=Thermosediminibacter litoriperuensis TaxID=291989 RepID=A0A5S5AXI4_9FIRM|nr:indolepyruvate ferredoxin oxidoreductase subunit alpha [Thermosediminibacter litoriperuensis]TYP58570.1 indolepyruvate ferredoxin oxidoreductase alpha subunit [Thermosediminibacter litoriperuensis]
MKKVFLTGNEAIARGAYEYGVTFASAYPGTPSTEILENIAKYSEIYSEWAPNEKVALEATAGASMAGARAIVSMKHVGLNVAADPLFTLAYTGVNGGLVIVSADDPGMHSSQNEQDNRNFAPFAKIPMLEPSDSQEAKDLVGEALKISEMFDTPVLFRTTTRVSHSRSVVQIGERQEAGIKPYVKNPEKFSMIPGFARKRRLILKERLKALEEYSEKFPYNRVEWGKSYDVGIITSGISYQYVKEVFGDEVSVLKLTMTFPLPKKMIAAFVEQVKEVYVVEELDPYLENQIRAMGLKVRGKELIPEIGELSAEILREALKGDKVTPAFKPYTSVPPRPPVLCPGCPHRGVFYVLKKMKAVVTSDIGCYSLGVLPPLESIDSILCMGASISMGHGFKKACEINGKDATVVTVIGDSTFLHSGITSLMDAVYNRSNTINIIVDNCITAMTGHQHHPGTGYNIKEEPAAAVSLEAVCRAIGVENVLVVDSYDLKAVEDAVKKALEYKEGPSVIIARRVCALLKGKGPKGLYSISEEKCRKCRMCLRLGCPAIQVRGDGIFINPISCVGCSVCVQVCPFGAIEKAGDE